MGVAHGASFPGKRRPTREPGSARRRQVEEANPLRRGWRTDQWRVPEGGAMGRRRRSGEPAASQDCER